MLSVMLDNLDDVDKKLKETIRDDIWKDCTLPKERYRSCTNIKTVLSTLVKRTIRDIQCQNEAKTFNQSDGVRNIPPNTQSLLTSIEFLAETKNLLIIPSKAQILHSYLMTFQDLLGDILYSICQMKSDLKFPLNISVPDLEKLQEHYISITESLAFNANNRTSRKTKHSPRQSDNVYENNSQIKIEVLHKSLQFCLKEMLKVKLEIEHYYKNNIIETQFKENNIPNYLQGQESIENNTLKNKHMNPDRSTSGKPHNLYVTDENKEKFVLYVPMDKTIFKSPSKGFKGIPKRFKEDKETVSSVFCSPVPNPWINDNNSGGLFQNPLLYSDLLFVEAERVLMETNKKPFGCKSLPKIYSLETIDQEAAEDLKSHKTENETLHTEKSGGNKSQIYDSNKIDNVRNNQDTSDSIQEEDMLSDESLTMDIKAKISSLFSLLRSNQLSDEDLFKEDSRKSDENVWFNSLNESNKMTKLQSNHHINKRPCKTQKRDKMYNDSIGISQSNKMNSQIKMPHGQKLVNRNEYEPSTLCNDEKTHSKSSLIELFKTSEIGLTPNTVSSQTGLSNSSSWPVAAKYINVSGSKRGSDNGSELSNNSISLAKSFEKSLYAIHLNKRYEHKQIYDGNLIVLDNTKTLVKDDSEYPLMNQSFVVFDVNHCEVNSKECARDNQREDNTISNLPALKGNPPLPYPISILPNMNKDMDFKKTMTVQYAQCGGVPYIAKQENFRQRHIDMFNIDGYNDINWNSFISIYTSKIGHSAKFKHHTMFGKIINNIGADYKRNSGLFNNVHTLTSNGGPFRLFDINGYPLTDTAGNVLKDPYGKSLVQLDATGFPKNNVKVFDAAGNTPEDIDFDPTQKPKTNTIIIKLTDSFKRPLHLFDKYGRPLTDALGKLLVNIHGRPLLRFDNFGRPNTDYRGGPLYTDEGFKWSYKTEESLINNQNSEERVKARKMGVSLENKLKQGSSSTVNLKGTHDDLDENQCENYNVTGNFTEETKLKSKNSDIWEKVENLLQHIPKRREFETGISETSVSETKNISEKSRIENILKPIIHHNDLLHRESCNGNRSTVRVLNNNNNNIEQSTADKVLHNTYFTFQNNYESGSLFENYGKSKNIYTYTNNYPANGFEGGENARARQNLAAGQISLLPNYADMLEGPMGDNKNQHYKDTLCNDNCTNCLHKSLFFHHLPNYQIKKEHVQQDNDFLNNGLMTISSSNQEDCNKISRITFKNNDYLNNLCNDILKYQLEYKDTVRREPIFTDAKTEKWTDTSYTLYTGSEDSKYTSDITGMNCKPYPLCESNKNKLKKIESYKNYRHPYKKLVEIKNVIKRIKPYAQFNESKLNNRSSKKQNQESSQNTTTNSPTDENVSSDGTSLFINVLNQDDIHYEINVSENRKKKMDGRGENQKYSNEQSPLDKDRKKVSKYEVQKCVQEIPNKITKKQLSKKNTEIDCRLTTSPETKHDSPFRFSSDTNLGSVIAINDKLSDMKYIDGKPIKVNNNIPQNKEYKSQNKKAPGDNYNNNKYNTLPDKSFIEEYNTNQKDFCQKVISDTKFNRFRTKGGYHLKKHAPTTKERNVTFLGNPVKYVLNKIDNTFPSRQNNVNKIISIPKTIKESSKEKEIDSRFTADQSHKNKTTSPTTKTSHKMTQEINKCTDDDRKHELIAFQSKSCIELRNQSNNFTMNYSGNENDSHNDSCHTQMTCMNIIHSQSTLRKCSSATFSSLERCTQYQFTTGKHRIDRSSIKQSSHRKNQTIKYMKNEQTSKDNRKLSHSRNKKPNQDTKKPNKDTRKRLVDKGKHCK